MIETGKGAYLTYLGLGMGNVVLSAAALLIFANSLSTDAYALYGISSSLAGLVLLVVNAGHKEALFKYASQASNHMLSRTAASLQGWLVPFFVLGAVLCLFSPWAGLAALMFTLVYVITAVSAAFRGRGYYFKDSAMWPLYRAIWVAGCAGILLFTDVALSLELVFGFGCIAALTTFFLLGGAKLVGELSTASLRVPWPFEDVTLKNFFFIEVATVAYMKVDVLMLWLFDLPAQSIASYFLSVQLLDAFVLLVLPLGYIFFNRINAETSLPARRSTLTKFASAVMLASIFLITCWSVIGQPIFETFFSKYALNFRTAMTLLVSLLPWGVTMILVHWSIAFNSERAVVWVFFAALLIHLPLCATLISVWGIDGAAYARVITECVIACVLLMHISRAGLGSVV